MLPRERVSYSTPFTRPRLTLPGGARMVVWSVVNVEEWELHRPMARQASPPPMGQPSLPDLPNWTWHEYGMRVGFWRLKEVFDRFGLTPTISLNAKVCETCPAVVEAAVEAGWDIMAHCYVQMPISQVENQDSMIRQSLDTIEAFTGTRPTGWLGPGRSQTLETPELLVRNGLSWFSDWILDDQPLWVKTEEGPIVSVPYSVELNDITVMISSRQESDALLTRVIDAFDQLYEESENSARVMAIGVHPYVTGAAHRIKYFEKIYEYIASKPGILHWNGGQINDWYRSVSSADEPTALVTSPGAAPDGVSGAKGTAP